jgi:hypothetical protein
MSAVLSVDNYTLDYSTRAGPTRVLDKVTFRICAGRGAGTGRRIRLGKIVARLRPDAAPAGQRA